METKIELLRDYTMDYKPYYYYANIEINGVIFQTDIIRTLEGWQKDFNVSKIGKRK